MSRKYIYNGENSYLGKMAKLTKEERKGKQTGNYLNLLRLLDPVRQGPTKGQPRKIDAAALNKLSKSESVETGINGPILSALFPNSKIGGAKYKNTLYSARVLWSRLGGIPDQIADNIAPIQLRRLFSLVSTAGIDIGGEFRGLYAGLYSPENFKEFIKDFPIDAPGTETKQLIEEGAPTQKELEGGPASQAAASSATSSSAPAAVSSSISSIPTSAANLFGGNLASSSGPSSQGSALVGTRLQALSSASGMSMEDIILSLSRSSRPVSERSEPVMVGDATQNRLAQLLQAKIRAAQDIAQYEQAQGMAPGQGVGAPMSAEDLLIMDDPEFSEMINELSEQTRKEITSGQRSGYTHQSEQELYNRAAYYSGYANGGDYATGNAGAYVPPSTRVASGPPTGAPSVEPPPAGAPPPGGTGSPAVGPNNEELDQMAVASQFARIIAQQNAKLAKNVIEATRKPQKQIFLPFEDMQDIERKRWNNAQKLNFQRLDKDEANRRAQEIARRADLQYEYNNKYRVALAP